MASTVLFLSCSKEKTTPEVPEEIPEEIPHINAGKLKSYTKDLKSSNGSTVFTYNLSYDGDNRISAVTVPEDPNFKIVYKYHSKDAYTKEESRAGTITDKRDYYFKNSRLDSVTAFNRVSDTTTGKYYYDDKNLLTHLNLYGYASGPHHYDTEFYNYDATGKLINYTANTYSFSFEYYPDLVYDLPVIEPVFPTPIKTNLLRRKITYSYDKITNDVAFSYTFDNKKRIYTKTETPQSGNITTYTYTYY